MRSLIVSAATLLVVVGIWFGFMTYCEDTISVLSHTLTQEIQVSVSRQDWPAAVEEFRRFTKAWHKEKTIYSLFLEQSAMMDTDFAIARAEAYIETQDRSNALGELACIREQLKFLFFNERITLENIF